MNKYFCFYCQKEVEPRSFFKWRFCPFCKHRITDNGDGFYRICDNCGANMPSSAKRCLKCGHVLFDDGSNELSLTDNFDGGGLLDLAVGTAALFLSIIIGIGVLYVSFYLVFFFAVIALAVYLYNFMISGIRK